jgi:hypothetical protein
MSFGTTVRSVTRIVESLQACEKRWNDISEGGILAVREFANARLKLQARPNPSFHAYLEQFKKADRAQAREDLEGQLIEAEKKLETVLSRLNGQVEKCIRIKKDFEGVVIEATKLFGEPFLADNNITLNYSINSIG